MLLASWQILALNLREIFSSSSIGLQISTRGSVPGELVTTWTKREEGQQDLQDDDLSGHHLAPSTCKALKGPTEQFVACVTDSRRHSVIVHFYFLLLQQPI